MSDGLAGQRVLFVSRSTTRHDNAGGMETSAAALVSAVQQLGATTALVTTRPASGQVLAGHDGHVAVWGLRTRRPGRYSLAWWRATAEPGPWLDWQPDLIVGVGDSAASMTSRRTSIPVVVHAHGTTVMEAWSAVGSGLRGVPKALLNLARTPHRARHLQAAAGVIAAGPAVRDALRRKPYRIAAERLSTVSNSVAAQPALLTLENRRRTRQEVGVAAGAPLLLFVGRLAADKGADTAVRVARSIGDCHLAIVGDGPELGRLRGLIDALGVADRVTLLGRRDRADVHRFMAGADVLVFPTRRREGLPMIVLEAAAAGLPVVSSTAAGLPIDLQLAEVTLVHAAAGPEAFSRAVQHELATRRHRAVYLPDAYSVTTLASRLSEALAPHLGTSP